MCITKVCNFGTVVHYCLFILTTTPVGYLGSQLPCNCCGFQILTICTVITLFTFIYVGKNSIIQVLLRQHGKMAQTYAILLEHLKNNDQYTEELHYNF